MGLVTHFKKYGLIETKKNFKTCLRYFNKNMEQENILTYIQYISTWVNFFFLKLYNTILNLVYLSKFDLITFMSL